MLELILFIISFVFLVLGLIGAIIPILPGPLLTYLAFLIIYLFTDTEFNSIELITYTVLAFTISFSDYFLQFFGVKKFGGGKNAVYGTIIGIIFGLFFAPIGLIVGPFTGAFIGALVDNKTDTEAVKIAFGSLIGFLFGTILKLIFSIYMIWAIIDKLFYLT